MNELSEALRNLAERSKENEGENIYLELIKWFTLFLKVSRFDGRFEISLQKHKPDMFAIYGVVQSHHMYTSSSVELCFSCEGAASVYFREFAECSNQLARKIFADLSCSMDYGRSSECLGSSTMTIRHDSEITQMLLRLVNPLYNVDHDTMEKLRVLSNMDQSQLNSVERVQQELCSELYSYYLGVLNGTRPSFTKEPKRIKGMLSLPGGFQ